MFELYCLAMHKEDKSGGEPNDAQKRDYMAGLKALAEASALFVALTFVGGWFYLSSYYKTFGLNILDWSISIEVVSAIALFVLLGWKWWWVAVGGILVILYVIARISKGISQGWAALAFLVMLTGTASAAVIRGGYAAQLDSFEDTSVLPNVAFAAKVMAPEPSCVEYQVYGTMDCKLLVHFNGTYYFFRALQQTDTGSAMNLYSIADGDLLGVHVQSSGSLPTGAQQ